MPPTRLPPPSRVTFSQAPRNFQPCNLEVLCGIALVLFLVVFVLYVLLPALSFGADLLSGEWVVAPAN